jgi:hypothetical protein
MMTLCLICSPSFEVPDTVESVPVTSTVMLLSTGRLRVLITTRRGVFGVGSKRSLIANDLPLLPPRGPLPQAG